jgi:hypothetical protein
MLHPPMGGHRLPVRAVVCAKGLLDKSTPGYWGWSDGVYVYHEGYWGPEIGFYGGVAETLAHTDGIAMDWNRNAASDQSSCGKNRRARECSLPMCYSTTG